MPKAKAIPPSKGKQKAPTTRVHDAPDPSLVVEGQRLRKPTARAGAAAAELAATKVIPKAKLKKGTIDQVPSSDDDYVEAASTIDPEDHVITHVPSIVSISSAEETSSPPPTPPLKAPKKKVKSTQDDEKTLEKARLKTSTYVSISVHPFNTNRHV